MYVHACGVFRAVNNFQNITAELVRKQDTLEQCEELARMKEELNLELTRHDARMEKARYLILCCV